MNWQEKWRSIAARIDGLLDAANFVAQTLQVANTFAGPTQRAMRAELEAVLIELRRLHEADGESMPEAAEKALQELVFDPPTFDRTAGHQSNSLQGLAPLFVFKARFDYLIRDSEVEGRNATELSFEHLNRLIDVDKNTRDAWKLAYETNEVACERIGSVHLLSHGIWAFKVVAGAATDLVYNEPLQPNSTVLRRSARALVLTEWKLIRASDDVPKVAAAARVQAEDYAAGVLGGLELRQTRYVVLVAAKRQVPPPDVSLGRYNYRHIWIAVDPDPPSVHGRRSAKSGSAAA